MNTYLARAGKYAAFLVLLFFVILMFMDAIGYTRVPVREMFTGRRSMVLLGVVIFFALLYPFMGFTKRRLTFNAVDRQAEALQVMALCGYQLKPGSTPELMVFETVSKVKKFVLFYEGPVTITTTDGISYIEGNRKEVVRAYFRMGTYIL